MILGAVVLAAILWLAARSREGGRRPASAADLRRKLQKLTHDAAVAERLVEAEMKRHPDLAEREILRRVIRRLERDRGR